MKIKIITVLAEKCQTASVPNGNCIILSECSSLNKLFKKRPITPMTADYLRKSQCGMANNKPKVCCPDELATLKSGNVSLINIFSVFCLH